MKKIVLSLSMVILTAAFYGCATAVEIPVVEKKPEATDPEPIVKYSTEPNYAPVSDRDYRQMTRQKMEDESALNAGAGSLWVMEGQTSYLFAQNKQRRAGDPTRIKIEGAALKQLETKVSTISELLNQLEEQRKQAELDQKKLEEDKKMDDAKKLRLTEIEKEKDNILTNGLAGTDPTADAIQKLAEENVNKRMPASVPDLKIKKDEKPVVANQKKEEKPDLKDVEFIPSRIIEKTPEGMYKISGQQMMTIQKRPYKVIATGMVRPEDFDDQSINSGKIFEPQYDIIHIKKTEKQ
ncbi:MAG: flagellar basal body L-ring protein FlgH [Bdellovibrionaceae bacterium]|nr:flagellar basal body L-ring protein FlgH [Pseudobdellovibrionaceae bacterium]